VATARIADASWSGGVKALNHAEFIAGAVAYAVASVLYFLHLAGRGAGVRADRFAPWLLGLGAIAHFAHLTSLALLRGECPLFGLDTALSLSAVVVVAAFLTVGRGRLRSLGAFAAPVALTFLIGAEFVSGAEAALDQPTLLAVHVAANLGGLGVFLVAGAMGAVYLVEERRLKSKRPRRATAKLPPLDVLDTVAHRLVLIGFPLLTVGIVTGAMFSARLLTGAPVEVARATLAYLAWCVVAGALILRSVAGWRGRRAAWAALIGASCILLVTLVYVVQPALGERL
jgi:ABC-type uncharacterized transport system permease subunit